MPTEVPTVIKNMEIVTCVPEEMRYMDLNSTFEEFGFRNMTNFDNMADVVAHVCAGTTSILALIVDQDDDTVAEQVAFVRLLSSRLIIIRMMDNLPDNREEIGNLTEDDYLLDFNNVEESTEKLLPILAEHAPAVQLFEKWLKEHVVSAPAAADLPKVAKTCRAKADAISANPDAINLQGAFLGRGALGDVVQANCTLISKPMACKNIDTKKLSPSLLKSLNSELSAMQKLPPSNHIVRFYFSTSPTAEHRRMYIELCKTTVQGVMKGGAFPVEMAKTVIQHLCKALEFLHFNNIVHRDVKPDNILVAYDGIYKLADLGSSIEVDPKTKEVTEKQDLAGTLKYMSPEVFNGKPYGTSADVWSVGIVLMDLIQQGLPKEASGPGGVDVLPSFFNPDRPDDHSPVPLPLSLPKDVSNFLVMCLQRDPKLRATPTQLLGTPFLKGPGMSAKNVSQYVGAQSAKAIGGNSAVIPALGNMVKNANMENLANSCSHSDVLSFLSKK